MRRAYKHLVLFALVSMLVGLGITASHPESSHAQTAPPPDPTDPNIVFILTDDMRKDDLKVRYMPETQRLVANVGMTFNNAFVTTPLCCPSRATIMRGQYAHNTGIWYNVNHFNPDGHDGGWEGYQKNGWEADNVATHLDAAGYQTGLFGKYLNQYGEGVTSLPDIPPGWDNWFAFLSPINYYDYDVHVGDRSTTPITNYSKHYGTKASDYSTDVLKSETLQFIDESVDADKPFFAFVAPKAPHGPATPAPRDRRAFDREKAPQLPSFDEPDVSDKPPWIRNLRRLTSDDKASINKRHEDRVESLQAVDDLVGEVVTKLESRGELNNTYIVFTSDNGWFHGEHRIRSGKGRPYEEAPRVPLVISGPDVQVGSSTDKLVLNTDYFPTFLELAGVPVVQWPPYLDGRSLLPVLNNPMTTSWTRTAILIEGRAGNDPEIPVDRNYNAIRTINRKYVEYEGGFKELYNLSTDRYELQNLLYPTQTADPGNLPTRLQELKGCAADTCRTAEDKLDAP
jgi:arylsulfatase A-like enzyme